MRKQFGTLNAKHLTVAVKANHDILPEPSLKHQYLGGQLGALRVLTT